jgi:methylated-DNA-[protein]-cysteine S-methyltransferase
MLSNINAPYYSELSSPLGPLLLLGDERALSALYMQEHRHQPTFPDGCQRNDQALAKAREQLQAYFAGELLEFELELSAEGTAFQRRVWQALRTIGFGETESYGGLARRIGNGNASRAVGLANGKNPISIIVPCHRVIGANGSLTGYGGGMERKQWLLQHEQRVAARHGRFQLQPTASTAKLGSLR